MEENHKSGNRTGRKTVTIPTAPAKLVGAAVLVIAVALIGFCSGVQYQKGHQQTARTSSFASNNGQYPSQGFGGGHRMGGFGTVTAVSDSSITVQNPRSGSTTTYSINGSTTVTDNGSTGSVSDIQTGDTVIVRTSGSASTTATQIMVNPSFGGGAGFGGGGANDGPGSTSGSAATD